MESRFIDLATVAEILSISMDQTYALVHSKQLKAAKIGGRGVWRVERSELEAYIQRAYTDTERLLDGTGRRVGLGAGAEPEASIGEPDRR